MHATNMSTAGSTSTYMDLERDCARLAEVARQMAEFAQTKDNFRDEPEFEKLKAMLNANYHSVGSPIVAIWDRDRREAAGNGLALHEQLHQLPARAREAGLEIRLVNRCKFVGDFGQPLMHMAGSCGSLRFVGSDKKGGKSDKYVHTVEDTAERAVGLSPR